MPVVSRSRPSQSFARVGNFDFCSALRDEAVLFADDRHRAAVDGGADEAVSIRLLSGNGHKDHARRHAARVISNARHLAVQWTFDANWNKLIDQLFQLHRHIKNFVQFGRSST